jgi:hypothetical protein
VDNPHPDHISHSRAVHHTYRSLFALVSINSQVIMIDNRIIPDRETNPRQYPMKSTITTLGDVYTSNLPLHTPRRNHISHSRGLRWPLSPSISASYDHITLNQNPGHMKHVVCLPLSSEEHIHAPELPHFEPITTLIE